MDVKEFLAGQADGVAFRRAALDAIRAGVVEANSPPECVQYVMGRIDEVFDRHSGTVCLAGRTTAREGAEAVEAAFRPMVDDLTRALAEALMEFWSLRWSEE